MTRTCKGRHRWRRDTDARYPPCCTQLVDTTTEQLSQLLPSLLPMLEEYMLHGAGLAAPVAQEAVRAAVLMSDLFRDAAQLQWLLRMMGVYLRVYDVPDDPLAMGWVFLGVCKVF